MSKYTTEQLKERAEQFIKAEQQGDMRALRTMTVLQALTGLSNREVYDRIKQMTK